MSAFFAHHTPLIRDYLVPPVPGPTPPDPNPTPMSPGPDAIPFSSVILPEWYAALGVASSTTLATITCEDASMTIRPSEEIPGLTFSYSSGVLSISGTPTDGVGRHGITVNFMASDGSGRVRGATTHAIVIYAPAQTLNISDVQNPVGRVHAPFGASICTLDIAADCLVTFTQDAPIPGLTFSMNWTRGALSSFGAVGLFGTPTFSSTYVVHLKFWRDGLYLGQAQTTVSISPYYNPYPAPVADTPAPSPATPLPPSLPGPTSGEAEGPDSLWANVAILATYRKDHGFYVYIDGTLPIGKVGVTGIDSTQERATFVGAPSRLTITRPGLDIEEQILAECLVDIDEDCWNGLMASGSRPRLIPLVYNKTLDSQPFWLLGLLSYIGENNYRVVRSVFMDRIFRTTTGVGYVVAYSNFSAVPNRPGRFIHVAGGRKSDTATQIKHAAWLGGKAGYGVASTDGTILATPSYSISSTYIGGVCDVGDLRIQHSTVDVMDFYGSIEEIRVTRFGRYVTYFGLPDNTDLPANLTRTPWPNR